VDADQRNRDRGHPAPVLLSRRSADEKDAAMASGRRLVSDLVSGIDFSREILLTAELGLGDTSLVEGDAGLDAMAVWHSAPLADAGRGDEVRVLKLAARTDAAFDAAIAAGRGGGSQGRDPADRGSVPEPVRRGVSAASSRGGIACAGPICG